MAYFVRMPQKGLTEETALLTQWYVKVGDAVKPGQLLFALETGKAVFDIEAEKGGTVLERIGNEGDEVAVKAIVMVIGEPGERCEPAAPGAADSPGAAAAAPASSPAAASPAVPAAPPAQVPPAAPPAAAAARLPSEAVPSRGASGGTRISPRARRLAAQHSLDYAGIAGSGPGGRILVEDIEASLAAAPAPATAPAQGAGTAVEAARNSFAIPVSPMRATIADRLSKSFFSAPHIFLRMAAEMDPLFAVRGKLGAESGRKLSLNAFIMKLAAESLKRHPRINAAWQGDSIKLFPTADIGLAVALDDGLIVPVVRDCGGKGIREIDAELSALVEKARTGRLSPSEYSNATFTISNLGSYGVEEFTAIINPPGSAILALGAAAKEPVAAEDGGIVVRTRMRMTLSCDHRSIDGAVGAAFLRDLALSIQEPLRALL